MNLTALSFLLLLIPFVNQAQSSQIKPPPFRTEIGFNLGHAPDNAYHYKSAFGHGGYIRSSLSLLMNRGNIQYGFTIEGGTNSDDYWYLSPGVVANYKFPTGEAYFYAGTMAGYICSMDMINSYVHRQKIAQGYAFGIQGGFVQPLRKRFSLTTELAARSTQLWQKEQTFLYMGPAEGQETTRSSTIIYFPVAVGFRYNL